MWTEYFFFYSTCTDVKCKCVSTDLPIHSNEKVCPNLGMVLYIILIFLCAGELVDPHHLLDFLGCAAVLQPVLWTSGLWSGNGHHVDRRPHLPCGCSVEEQTPMALQNSWWVGLCKYRYILKYVNSQALYTKSHLAVCFVAEIVTYVGQKLCYVVFPQGDPSETEPLTSSKATDWAVQSTKKSLFTSTPVPVFVFKVFHIVRSVCEW